MKNFLHSRTIQLPRARYRFALIALVAVAAAVMLLAPVTARAASTPTTPTLTVGTVNVMPDSASGCNQSVCISVCNNSSCTGSGLFIDHVSASGSSSSRNGCVQGQMLVRGSVRETTNATCWLNPPGSTEFLSAYFPVGYNINNGSQVCVKFIGLGAPSGKPCETVHS